MTSPFRQRRLPSSTSPSCSMAISPWRDRTSLTPSMTNCLDELVCSEEVDPEKTFPGSPLNPALFSTWPMRLTTETALLPMSLSTTRPSTLAWVDYWAQRSPALSGGGCEQAKSACSAPFSMIGHLSSPSLTKRCSLGPIATRLLHNLVAETDLIASLVTSSTMSSGKPLCGSPCPTTSKAASPSSCEPKTERQTTRAICSASNTTDQLTCLTS